MQIIIVRPGATDLDEQGRITGNLDVPLSETGKEQAAETAAELRDHPISLIYTAPGLASQETATILAAEKGTKVRVEEHLTNLDLGLWHGKRLKELKKNQPTHYRKWLENPNQYSPPNGETALQVRERIAKSIRKIKRKHRDEIVVIVAPEPLACIIRSELQCSEMGNLKQCQRDCGSWESINVSGAVA